MWGEWRTTVWQRSREIVVHRECEVEAGRRNDGKNVSSKLPRPNLWKNRHSLKWRGRRRRSWRSNQGYFFRVLLVSLTHGCLKQLWTNYEYCTDRLRVILCKGYVIVQMEVPVFLYYSTETWICLVMLLQAIPLQYFECKGDFGRKVDIVGGDNICHCEKVRINMCLILIG